MSSSNYNLITPQSRGPDKENDFSGFLLSLQVDCKYTVGWKNCCQFVRVPLDWQPHLVARAVRSAVGAPTEPSCPRFTLAGPEGPSVVGGQEEPRFLGAQWESLVPLEVRWGRERKHRSPGALGADGARWVTPLLPWGAVQWPVLCAPPVTQSCH